MEMDISDFGFCLFERGNLKLFALTCGQFFFFFKGTKESSTRYILKTMARGKDLAVSYGRGKKWCYSLGS